MKQAIMVLMAFAVCFVTTAAVAADGAKIRLTPRGSQPSAKGPDSYFTGTVRVDGGFGAEEPGRIVGAYVTFEPGARTAWHTHPAGQWIHITAGKCLVQEKGGPIEVALPGDSVWFPPNVSHWHGAAPDTAATHLAVAETINGQGVTWQDKVTDEEYGELSTQTGKKSQSIEIIRSGSMPSGVAAAQNFTGVARTDPVFPTKAGTRFYGAYVSFEPGSRTNWHTHANGQTILVTMGRGYFKQEGEPAIEVRQGDSVWIPAGVNHFHAAAADTAFVTISMSETPEGGRSTEWGVRVTDEEYAAAVGASGKTDTANKPLSIARQGSFAVGGTVVSNPGTFDYKTLATDGQTIHGDHASVSYQIPASVRKFPIAFLHGAGQSARTWQTTPDGREGFQDMFLRRGYGVYMIDQPRRGQAGQSTVAATIPATPSDQLWYSFFRIGNWPDYYPGVQFPKDAESLNQYFRQMTPNTGPYDQDIISDAVAALFKRIGPGILVTHSQGGGPGWLAAIKSENIKAVVAYEPGSSFVFPEGELPEPMPSLTGTLEGFPVPLDDFMKLTKIPVVVYYGDNIPEQTDIPGQDNWRVRLAMAKIWVKAINDKGGDATLVHLPEIGVRGNTHFPFSDLNNVGIADLMEKFLAEKGLN